MNRQKYIEQISDQLGTLAYQVKARNSLDLFDINIHAEDFFKELLNLIFDYKLENLNITDDKNKTAIDLGDKSKKIAVQVTSETNSTKIHDTIKKFLGKILYKGYNRLVFLIIRLEKKKFYATFDKQNQFKFNKEEDILFIEDLLSRIRNQETTTLQKIVSFLEDELVIKIGQPKSSESNEVETIIKLIDFLSNNRNYDNLREEKEPDPHHKIYRRFSDHSSFLTKLYKDLAPLYINAVTEAKDVIGLDTAIVRLIAVYLKDISDRYLNRCEGDPRLALDELTDFFEEKISSAGVKHDRMAIKFYLLSELIGCNVFPNEED